jgi:hypothetical protein
VAVGGAFIGFTFDLSYGTRAQHIHGYVHAHAHVHVHAHVNMSHAMCSVQHVHVHVNYMSMYVTCEMRHDILSSLCAPISLWRAPHSSLVPARLITVVLSAT